MEGAPSTLVHSIQVDNAAAIVLVNIEWTSCFQGIQTEFKEGQRDFFTFFLEQCLVLRILNI